MSFADWLRGWQSVATVASKPSALDELLAEKRPRPAPGEQVFIPIDEMTDKEWALAQSTEPAGSQRRPGLFSATPPDRSSFPMP